MSHCGGELGQAETVAKVTGRLESRDSGGGLLVLRNDGDMTTVTMVMIGETQFGLIIS